MDLLIGGLAALSGESVKTLRFWTDRQLLRAGRGENGYRVYGPDAPAWVSFIRSAQALGLPLATVRRLLRLVDQEASPCGQVQDELTRHLGAVRDRIAALQTVAGALEARLEEARAEPCGESGCRFLPPTL